MKKDIATRNERAERLPEFRRPSSFLSPWFEDIFDYPSMLDPFLSRDFLPFERQSRFLKPAIDIDETTDEYIVSADLPGVKKEDVSIECTGNQLTISAERKYESVAGRKSERQERYYGSFQRSFALPSGADADQVEASFEGGVLTVRIPKGEQARSRKIEIGDSSAKGRKEISKH